MTGTIPPGTTPPASGRLSRRRALAAAGSALLLPLLPARVRGQDTQPAPGSWPAGLTPVGAEQGANSRETIPAWTGGLSTLAANYVEGQPHPDPLMEDGRWFTVTAAEVDRYAVRLSAGSIALLKAYPDRFSLPMFPTRRTAAYPQAVYDATIANDRTAHNESNGLAVRGARVGIPFPRPKTGDEAMWNHVLRWRGESMRATDNVFVVEANGQRTAARYRRDMLSPYAKGETSAIALMTRRTVLAPQDKAGEALVLNRSIDPIAEPPQFWYRAPGKPRVIPAPDFSYDRPDPATGGVRTADMMDMFSGTMDRFNFTLAGKREMYVPYNAYRLDTPVLGPDDFLWPGHLAPNFLRYEMHRVWVVEAVRRPGSRHAFARRVYYLDEDSWQILMAEHYDAKGALVRYAEAHCIQFTQVPCFAPTLEIAHDLTTGRYVVSGVDNQEKAPSFNKTIKKETFSRNGLQKEF